MRLGPTSAALSQKLANAPSGKFPDPIELTCAQVPNTFDMGSEVLLWLGSDNNKGQPTAWKQGIHALAKCTVKTPLPERQFELAFEDVYILPRTVEKEELLRASPETYTASLMQSPIVGINNYASQVVQVLNEAEFATIGALLATLLPDARDELFKRIDGAENVVVIPPMPQEKDIEPADEEAAPPPAPPYNSEIPDNDPVLLRVRQLIADQVGGILLIGPPGTGKSWYAREVAIKLTEGIRDRIRDVQFHPSYQYEDFVEGNVPTSEGGFRMTDKHLLEMAVKASKTSGSVVLIIDEFSRSDPSRVLGDAMTYMEGSMRDKDFYLTSGRRARLPSNLIFIATMNPEDRSVDEIDDAMDRRWAKIELKPDSDKLRQFLQANAIRNEMIAPIMSFFVAIQPHVQIGHAFFRKVRDSASLDRLWENQLQYLVRKRFRFDAATREEIEGLWNECIEAVRAIDAAPAAPSA